MQRTLGDAVALAVDALLQDDSPEPSSGSNSARSSGDGNQEEVDVAERVKRIRERKREAVESLAHVRDLLQGSATEVDEIRLYGEEEHRKRQALKRAKSGAGPQQRQNRSPGQGGKELPAQLQVKPPEPVRVAIPPTVRPSQPAEHRRQKSTPEGSLPQAHPIATLPRSPQVRSNHQTSPFSIPFSQSMAPPRQRVSPSSTSTTSAFQDESMQAPWNYTKSSFSMPSAETAGMPRLPPRSAGSAPHDGQSRPEVKQTRKTSNDPLGVLSSS